MAENVTNLCGFEAAGEATKARGGIYIHIPFCLKKCYYCDFYSIPIGEEASFHDCDCTAVLSQQERGESVKEQLNTEDLRARYTRALLAEIEFYGAKYGKLAVRTGEDAAATKGSQIAAGDTLGFAVDSIFFGGGTPSLMEPTQIADIIEALKRNFEVSGDCEISMECNPKTLNADNLAGFRLAGVNRLSIGVQSFDDEILEGLGRVHRAADAEETVEMARAAGFDNINIDLMFAVPKQDMDKWMATVDRAVLSINPEHISFYSLEIAEGTPFDKMVEAGQMQETEVELDRQMYKLALARMEEEGYEHYEISNVSLPGRECRHNQKYWHFEDYLGLGPSAHSFMRGIRTANVSDIEEYMQSFEGDDWSDGCNAEAFDSAFDGSLQQSESRVYGSTLQQSESRVYGSTLKQEKGGAFSGFPQCVEVCHRNDFHDNVSEYVFTALRTREGVDLEKFRRVAGEEFWSVFCEEKEEFDKYVEAGYAVSDAEHIALTKKGIDISNKIMAIFV